MDAEFWLSTDGGAHLGSEAVDATATELDAGAALAAPAAPEF